MSCWSCAMSRFHWRWLWLRGRWSWCRRRSHSCTPSWVRFHRYAIPVSCSIQSEQSRVLVIDAGHDVNNINSTIPLYFIRASEGKDGSMTVSCLKCFRSSNGIELYTRWISIRFSFPKEWCMVIVPLLILFQISTLFLIRYPRARGVGGSTVRRHNSVAFLTGAQFNRFTMRWSTW